MAYRCISLAAESPAMTRAALTASVRSDAASTARVAMPMSAVPRFVRAPITPAIAPDIFSRRPMNMSPTLPISEPRIGLKNDTMLDASPLNTLLTAMAEPVRLLNAPSTPDPAPYAIFWPEAARSPRLNTLRSEPGNGF